MRNYLLVFIALIGLSSCGGKGSSSGSAVANPYPQATLITVGDSICNGQTASLGWADRIRNLGYNVAFKECKNGRIMARMGDFLPGLIDTYHPTHVLIMLGTNDAINGYPNRAISGLQVVAREAADRGVIAIIATIPPSSRNTETAYNVGLINSGIHRLKSMRIAEANAGISVSMLTDGVHPNDEGQEVIVNAFLSKLR